MENRFKIEGKVELYINDELEFSGSNKVVDEGLNKIIDWFLSSNDLDFSSVDEGTISLIKEINPINGIMLLSSNNLPNITGSTTFADLVTSPANIVSEVLCHFALGYKDLFGSGIGNEAVKKTKMIVYDAFIPYNVGNGASPTTGIDFYGLALIFNSNLKLGGYNLDKSVQGDYVSNSKEVLMSGIKFESAKNKNNKKNFHIKWSLELSDI